MDTFRTRLIRSTAVAAMAAALGIGLAGVANAQASPTFPGCGDPKADSMIWNGVNPDKYTPTNKGSNRDIVWPNGDSSRGWAVHEGQKPAVNTDLLVVPTVRETGIECDNLLRADAPEYFKHAYDEVGLLPKGTDWALAINSADKRGQDQMHIHLTRLSSAARADIDAASNKLGSNEHDWLNSVVQVKGRSYRAWNAGSMNHNLFGKLNDEIVQPLRKQGYSDAGMSHETILVTANHQGSGFVVLESDENTGLKPNGVNNLETLLDKG
jgi:CDP-diacylglycerol pyrophosphatase